MASPPAVNLKVYQGDRYELFFRVREQVLNETTGLLEPGDYADLTGWTPSCDIRKSKTDAVIATTVCSLADQDDPDTKGGVLVVLLPSQSVLLTEPIYLYDVQLELDADHITTYLQGQILVTGEVTHA